MFTKDYWEGIGAFFDAVRIPIVLIAVGLLLAYPGSLKSLIERLGFQIESFEFEGLKLVAKSSTADLDATASQLKQATAALSEADDLLKQIDCPGISADLKQKVADFLKSNQQLVQNSKSTFSVAAEQVSVAQIKIQTLAPAPPPSVSIGNSLYVFGADKDIPSALDEIRNAEKGVPEGSAALALFRKGNFYRSAAIFTSDEGRNGGEATINSAVGRTGQPVSLSNWCPGAQRLDDATSKDGKVKVPVYQC